CRGQRIGRALFDEFQRSFDYTSRIAFCDFIRTEKARLRPSLFPVEGRYSIRRVVGFAMNIALAGGEVIAAYRKVEEGDWLPEVCNLANSFDMDKIVEFDASVAGRNRSSALKEVRQMDGFVGMVAQDHSKRVVGYAMSLPGVGHREITVGPVYAVNLVTAICLLRELCSAAADDKIVHVHVPHMGHRILRFLHDKALCDVDKQFDRFYTHSVNVPADDFSKIFAISAKILLPDC
uniref:Sugar phosphate transporter domain-containing protein n=1 Tax=Parascaris univalens TaxID=6257 RepID=A0A914ZSH8_PARUN